MTSSEPARALSHSTAHRGIVFPVLFILESLSAENRRPTCTEATPRHIDLPWMRSDHDIIRGSIYPSSYPYKIWR
ncbi:hypothetical protein BDV59DRAFT_189374 [Aspergillus ambiguus]|uniref:uncharacterized protein n=1 Tax=Aspergillus ambiguus TaxID=176160 RepID=UPI003CCD7981